MLGSAIFRGLTTENYEKYSNELVIKKPLRNSIIFEEEQKNDGVYYVKSGVIKRFIRGIDGRECIFEFCGAGDLFGHRSVFSNENHFDSAVCLTDTVLHFLPKNTFIDIVKSNDVILQDFITSLSDESIRQIKHSQLLGQFNLSQRTAFALLYLQSKNSDPERWEIEISRDDLSNYIGTVKESAVRTMLQMKEDGVINSSGRKIRLLQPNALRAISKNII